MEALIYPKPFPFSMINQTNNSNQYAKVYFKMIVEALQGFDKVIPKRHVLPECECLKIDSRGFTGTDLEITLYRPFPGLP